MKKITIKVFLLMFFLGSYIGASQTLDQAASWPNGAWTVTGTFNPLGLLSDPTVDSTFSFDDDAATNGSFDDIQATSPVIDLTAASVAGETWLTVSGVIDYYLLVDVLTLEVYDADAMTWSVVQTFAGNTTTPADFQNCVGAEAYTSNVIDISGYTATQLSGFQYRFSYDDLDGWEWGFCLTSPTITSATPPMCLPPSNLTGEATASTEATLSWDAGGSETLWDVEVVDLTGGGSQTMTATATGVANPYIAMGLTEGNDYEYYVRADCGGDTSSWVGPFAWTQVVPPANDTFAGAIPIVPSAAGTGCAAFNFMDSTGGDGTTDSGLDGSCNGDNTGLDRFYTWTATTDALIWNDGDGNPGIVIRDAGTQAEITCAGTFAADDTVLSGWTVGQDLVIQVYDFNTADVDTSFCLEEFTLPVAPDCTETPISPGDMAVDVVLDGDAVTLTWTAPSAGVAPTDYQILFGDTSGMLNDLGALGSTDTMVTITGLDFSTTYYWSIIALNGPTPATGCAEWSFTTEAAPPPPVNDDCANATALTAGLVYTDNPVDGTLVSATDSGFTNTCGGTAVNDVWYTVVVPSNGEITIETGADVATGTAGNDTAIEAYTSDSDCSGTLTSVGCDDDGAATGAYSLLELTGLTGGETLYIRVWGFGDDEFEPYSISAYSATLSTVDFDQTGFTYYPNPVKNTLTLNAQNAIENVTMFNMLGQEVLNVTPNNVDSEIDMSSLNSGAYFVKVTIENTTKTIRVVKE